MHVPWENGGAPTTGSCKSTPLQYADASRKKVRLENLSSTMAAARYRSCGGPGAGGFLLAPADDSVWMEDTQSKSAIVCRLGGLLRLVADSGTALCQHEGAAGTCMTCLGLDLDGIHSSICPVRSMSFSVTMAQYVGSTDGSRRGGTFLKPGWSRSSQKRVQSARLGVQ